MKAIAYLPILGLLALNVSAQDMSVNAGIRAISSTNLSESLTAPKHYRYKQFQNGRIFYKNGKISDEALFNYDFVRAKMLTIQPNGDTIVWQNDQINFYKVANEFFLNSPFDIIEIHSTKDKIQLGVSAKYVVKRIEQISSNGYETGYDATGGTSASSRGLRKVIMDNSFSYYICMDNNSTVFKATRKKIVKTFIKKVPKIEEYIDMNNINFKSGQELESLVAYLNSSMHTKLKD